eukprot:Pgem_evm1s10262
MPHTTCHMPHTTYRIPHTTYPIPHTPYHISHTRYQIPYTIYQIPDTTYLMPHTTYYTRPYSHYTPHHIPRPPSPQVTYPILMFPRDSAPHISVAPTHPRGKRNKIVVFLFNSLEARDLWHVQFKNNKAMHR